ncbi:MAG: S8 family peptidase [Lachnospiraceae bacterium]
MPDNCSEIITSEDYADFIVPTTLTSRNFNNFDVKCVQSVSPQYQIEHIALSDIPQLSLTRFPYFSIPSLFTLLDTSSMDVSQITTVQNQPILKLRGKNILIGFIDTGIDYTNEVFRNPDGTTRIASIWDQTILEGPAPADLTYGTEYTDVQINEALRSEKPLEIVPSQDTDGHGTFMAGIAAGSASLAGDFIGAAPESTIAMVKLKPAKQYLRDFLFIKEDAIAYQENDIMLGIRYLELVAIRLKMPIVICIGLGTNQGSHTGASPLSEVLTNTGKAAQNIVVIAAGNEGLESSHFLGVIEENTSQESVEIRVAEGESGFALEFWATPPEIYSVSIQSPTGEVVPRIPARYGQSQELSFIFEATKIYIDYQLVEEASGGFLILLRFKNPTAGIWTINVYNSLFINGNYHMWLPVSGFKSPDTVFLRPNPYTTITIPGNANFVLTTSTYNHTNGSLYLHASRGFSRDNHIKPIITAPGGGVYGPMPRGAFVNRTGSSIAAAHMAGASALLLDWAVNQGHQPNMNTDEAITFFIRGADRNEGLAYPNREWGYGTLNMYQVFQRLTSLD